MYIVETEGHSDMHKSPAFFVQVSAVCEGVQSSTTFGSKCLE
jgi:hypothetical protein